MIGITKASSGGGGASAVFAYTENNVSITAGTETPITGLEVDLETGFYQCNVWLLCEATSASSGDISNSGTAVFDANLLGEIYSDNGGIQATGRPTDFETSGGLAGVGAGFLLTFTGVIKVTSAGTVILNGTSLNAPDAFIITENSTINFTKIGDI